MNYIAGLLLDVFRIILSVGISNSLVNTPSPNKLTDGDETQNTLGNIFVAANEDKLTGWYRVLFGPFRRLLHLVL